MKQKLFVFCIDALCSSDIEWMSQMPHFGKIIESGSYVKHVEPVYPSITYVCHTSIMTGKYPKAHGINQNEIVQRGRLNSPWFNMKQDVRAETLLDVAKANGRTTCSISWPVTGGADYDLNLPMIVPYNYRGYHPEQYLTGTATEQLLETYFWKYGRYLKGQDRSMDLFTMAVAPDLIRDFGQPDVMLVKMCDLDTIRHTHGVYHEKAKEQLRKHDEEFGVLLESVRRYGDADNTNFVILGDHGQTDVELVLNFNVLLQQNGFLRLNEDGTIRDYDALCHSTGLSAWIELKDPDDEETKRNVFDFLCSLRDDPEIRLKHIFTKEEAEAQYHLTGPFDFVIEGEGAISFNEDWTSESVVGMKKRGDKKIGNGSHGGLPHKKEMTTFIASGPAVRQGIVIERGKMVDEASTMARMLGLSMDNTDGSPILGMLR
ncbi:alkaline phosphatase family protein [Cohnella hongkongensis]|uniref:Alkaline phosphatase family protein n=1 Tax=Cohnella hongkongensis TaxID=178337 RepID=A0ABV9FCI8_9BACL